MAGQVEDFPTIGIDIGSTTVKGVVLGADGHVLRQEYLRHGGRQQEVAGAVYERLRESLGAVSAAACVTGSGGGDLAAERGLAFIQEVNALTLAVERRLPGAAAIVELGGQDAKLILLRDAGPSGHRRKLLSMNDKCAGGTGAVIDRIAGKLGLDAQALRDLHFDPARLYPVATKCGVFAESDINSLQKQGVAPAVLMGSLFNAIVVQNLNLLARGNRLRPQVVLLGGPHRFLPALVEAWRNVLLTEWRAAGLIPDEGGHVDDWVLVPALAEYFPAMGAATYARSHAGTGPTRVRLAAHPPAADQTPPWSALDEFRERYRPRPFQPHEPRPGEVVEAFVGLDAGSTTCKGTLVGRDGSVLAKSYRYSCGNPLDDARAVLDELHRGVQAAGARLRVVALGITGYAKDSLAPVLGADLALVETVAHARAATHFHDAVDVICDVGGQDIKVMILRDGEVIDFRLNTQCSAGNGFFLQATAQAFGIAPDAYADLAFSADAVPDLSLGCAVFLQAGIVDLQRRGWDRPAILAGLAKVLPQNVWIYAAGIPSPRRLGRRFVLQGGVHRNLAVVKAQLDFLGSGWSGDGPPPEVVVHEHCGESGAIGVALELRRQWQEGRASTFIGFERLRDLSVTVVGDDTRCSLCVNHCQRLIVEQNAPQQEAPRRFVVSAGCEAGMVDKSDTRLARSLLDRQHADNPNFAAVAAREVWRPRHPAAAEPAAGVFARLRPRRVVDRSPIRIGIPRVLNLYALNPLFSAYFERLGVAPGNLVYSRYTDAAMFRSGSRQLAIDPCFPSKVVVAHLNDLLRRHGKRPIDFVFLPLFGSLPSRIAASEQSFACPTETATPEAARAAFQREHDLLAEAGLTLITPFLEAGDRRQFEGQLFDAFERPLRLERREHLRAVAAGFDALARYEEEVLRRPARAVIDRLEAQGRIGIVLLGRSYHADPGINHGIPERIRALGFPVLTQDALPSDPDLLERLFGEEIRAGHMADPFDLRDVWERNYNESNNRKLWAAKFVARHPNLLAVEISSFRCGMDAMQSQTIARILEAAGKPLFRFADVDENEPEGSIRIRLESIRHFLEHYRVRMTATE